MKEKKSHKLAALFMAVTVAGSIPLGINHSLSNKREDAAGEYYYDQAGYAIYEGLENRRESASNLITLAERYQEGNPELAKLIDELEYRVQTSEQAYDEDDNLRKTAAANAALDAPAQALAGALQDTELAEKDRRYPQQLIDNMRSEQDKINRSSYNTEAKKFNEKLVSLQPMALLKPMAVFSDISAVQVQQTTGDETDPVTTANGIAQAAEEFADNIADNVEDGVEGLVDGILDGIFG